MEGELNGKCDDIEYYLIFNGRGNNTLNKSFCKNLKQTKNKKVIYADRCLVDEETLEKKNIVFKQIPYEVRSDSPLIIIDEGHKTKTPLSIEFLKDLNPSFIIEYTATPRPESNVLVAITSSELKEEKIIYMSDKIK